MQPFYFFVSSVPFSFYLFFGTKAECNPAQRVATSKLCDESQLSFCFPRMPSYEISYACQERRAARVVGGVPRGRRVCVSGRGTCQGNNRRSFRSQQQRNVRELTQAGIYFTDSTTRLFFLLCVNDENMLVTVCVYIYFLFVCDVNDMTWRSVSIRFTPIRKNPMGSQRQGRRVLGKRKKKGK